MKRPEILPAFGLFFILILLTLSGCMYFQSSMKMDEHMIRADYQAVDTLLSRLPLPLDPEQRVLTASFVDIDNLEESTTFGRTISEHFASRLSQHGLHPVEMKLRESVFIKERKGEFILSRDLRHLSGEHQVPVVFVGTYSVARHLVYISARVVEVKDNAILASYDYRLPMGENVKEMLRKERK